MKPYDAFDDAYEPWMPTLWDIIHLQGDPEYPPSSLTMSNLYYRRFGFDQLDVPDNLMEVKARMCYLTQLFNSTYAERMLNKETMETWQMGLQRRFDEVSTKYERAYRMYAEKELEMMEDIEEGTRTTATSKGKMKSIDTPDSAINSNPDYADNLAMSDNSSEVRTVYTGKGLVRSANDNIDEWRDLDYRFIKEFENNFLNVFWY